MVITSKLVSFVEIPKPRWGLSVIGEGLRWKKTNEEKDARPVR